MFAWLFITELYLQRVLNYAAMQVELAFLPANIIMAVFSLGLSAKLVMRFGIRTPLCLGLLMAAMSDVAPDESGLASGVVNTSFMMGGALGLAILASLAVARTDEQMTAGVDAISALNSGYHLAFMLGAIAAAIASVLAGVFVRTRTKTQTQEGVISTATTEISS